MTASTRSAPGQTIVYTIHDKVGHLGIFVSAGVAKKEHDEFAHNIDLIDMLPPGLYEAVFEPRGELEDAELVTGDWAMRCEARTLDDIRALGGNDLEDERCFAAAARLSEINLALYRALVQPFVKASVTPTMAEAMRRMHPLRVGYEMFGAANPWLDWIESAASTARDQRRPVARDNPWLAFQEQVSQQIVDALEATRKTAEKASEDTFRALYGAPIVQAALGIDTVSERPPRKAPRNLLHNRLIEHRITELRAAMTQGGLREALVRSLIYVSIARGRADERGFEAIRRIRQEHAGAKQLPLAEFKAMIREQFYMLLIDEDAALAAIPAMLPEDVQERAAAMDVLVGVIKASGRLEGAAPARLERIVALFDIGDERGSARRKRPAAPKTAAAAPPGADGAESSDEKKDVHP